MVVLKKRNVSVSFCLKHGKWSCGMMEVLGAPI